MKSFFILELLLSAVVYVKADAQHLGFDEFNEFEYMNLSANPCENFYEFTCGNFRNLHPLENGEDLIDQFTILEEKLALAVNEILSSEVNLFEPEALQKAKSAYNACVDDDYMNTYDLINPEVNIVNKYGGFPILGLHRDDDEEFGWNTIADIAAEFGIGIFFSPVLFFDTQNATKNLLRITADGVDTPSQFRPDHAQSYEQAIEDGFKSMSGSSEDSSLLNTNQRTVAPMEILLRKLVLKLNRNLRSHKSDEYLFDKVSQISSFLAGIYNGGLIPNGTEIGPISTEASATLGQLNEWTEKHFGDSVELDWVEYVKRLLQYTHVDVDEDFLVVNANSFNITLYGIINWVKTTDPEVVKSAALLRGFIYTAADSDSESREYFEEYLKAIDNPVYPRWEYCTRKLMDATGTLALGLAVVYQYQLENFRDSKLENAQSLINNVQSTFKEVIEEASWMDDISKKAAQVKADNIISLLGFPDFVKNRRLLNQFYENLEVTTWDHYSNAKRIRAFQQAYTLNMITKRDRKAWEKSPFDVNAYYNRQNNRIIFPLAMLHPIFFHGSVSLLDYSRIGMVIAHEITHGFDLQGYLYNQDGIIEPWWSTDTLVNFVNITQCFVDQYSQYVIPQINDTISGKGSLNENIADNGGLRNAHRAFQKVASRTSATYTIGSSTREFTEEQLFFIGYGTMWCNSESDSYLLALQQTCELSSSCHATAAMRVNGVLANLEAFAEAFQCPVGSALNPETRCRLW